MENPFLNRSSLVLGLFLAVAPLANAATDDSTLDNPEVLKNLLDVLGKKADTDAANGQGSSYLPASAAASAPGDVDTIEQLLPLISSKEPAPEETAAPIDESLIIQSMLVEVEKANEREALAAATAPVDEESAIASLLPLVDSQEPEILTDEIFEPTARNLGFNDTIPTRNGLFGFGIARQASTAFGEHTLVTGSMRYHVSENWDALLGAEVSVDSLDNPEITDGSGTVLMSSGRTFRVLNAGLGYTLLNGLTSFDGGQTYVPWKLNADAVLGQQFTGGNNGMYYGFGTSLQILKDDYWIGIDTRYFRVNDDVLNKVGTHRGLQWGLTAGFYY